MATTTRWTITTDDGPHEVVFVTTKITGAMTLTVDGKPVFTRDGKIGGGAGKPIRREFQLSGKEAIFESRHSGHAVSYHLRWNGIPQEPVRRVARAGSPVRRVALALAAVVAIVLIVWLSR